MHWRHLALSTALASVALAVFVTPVAFAGGWAVTTLDELPTVIRAGQTYPIGYTIRRHGQTPFVGAQSAIEIRSPNGGTTERFAGQPEGAPGHYVAQVRFPEPGDWEWIADQAPFQRQPLGSISVMPVGMGDSPVTESVAAQPAPAAVTSGAPVVLITTVLAVALIAWRLVVLVRPSRSAVSRAVPKSTWMPRATTGN
jgi:hypothetical protein